MKIKPFCLTPNEINLKACEFSLSNRGGNEQFVLLATYGALMDPDGDMYNRVKDDFGRTKGHALESKEDIQKYFLGFYKIPETKIHYQKKVVGNENEGKATLVQSRTEDCYVAIWALPRTCFKMGSVLMNSEGSVRPFNIYHEKNQYVLRSNCIQAIEIVDNPNRPSPEWFTGEVSTFYLFLAGEKHVEYYKKLLPSPDYVEKIVNAYRTGIDLGYDIPESYLNLIQVNAMII